MTLWHRITAELERRNRGPAWLAREIGMSDQAVNNWSRRGVPPARYKQIADALSWTVDQLLDEDWTPTQHPSEGLRSRPVAQVVSLQSVEDAPHVQWGEQMHQGSPVFWVSLPDDAMAPRAAAGKLICFDTRETPRPGDGVLVVDRRGDHYFRVYRAGPAGRWSAHALNPAFDALDSERDGLRVLAVLKAEEGRWG